MEIPVYFGRFATETARSGSVCFSVGWVHIAAADDAAAVAAAA